MKKPSSKARKI